MFSPEVNLIIIAVIWCGFWGSLWYYLGKEDRK